MVIVPCDRQIGAHINPNTSPSVLGEQCFFFLFVVRASPTNASSDNAITSKVKVRVRGRSHSRLTRCAAVAGVGRGRWGLG